MRCRSAFRNRRRSVAFLIVGSIFYLTNPDPNPNLTHVNQIYIKYFIERGMCYKTDKVLKKTWKKKC